MFSLHDNLYHYTPSSTAVGHILKTMTLKMGSLSTVNDPRESKSWPFTIYAKNGDGIKRFNPNVFEELSAFITQRTLILCFTRDDPTLHESADDRTYRSGFGHPRMWAQYADRHTGVCLVFNHQKLRKCIETAVGVEGLFHGPVKYLNSGVAPEPEAYQIAYLEDLLHYGIANWLESHVRKFSDALFFFKHLDWQDEWEYRWVYRSKNQDAVYIPIEKCIQGVLVGEDCEPSSAKALSLICKEKNIPLYRLHQHGWADRNSVV